MGQADFASQTQQFPLNSAGVFGQNAIVAYGRFYTASGGMVGLGQIINGTGIATGIKNASPQGWPGMGATLVGTGLYNVMHPPDTIVAMFPMVATPSGTNLDVNVLRPNTGSGAFNPATGITQLQVFSTPTGGTQLTNPPTGCRFDILAFVSPNNSSRFSQF